VTFFKFFFSLDQPATLILNPLIWGITIAGLVQIVRSFRFTTQNLRADLDKMRSGDLTSGDEMLARARTLSGVSPVRKRLEQLEDLHVRGEPVDGEILAAIAAEEFRDAAPMARWATSVLVLLGLAGTLIGLGLAVSGLSSALGSGGEGVPDPKGIVDAILATLGGMRVAFSTTLSGVFGAVLVGSGLAALRHAQSEQIRRMESLSATRWAPAFQTSEESRMSDVVEQLEGVRKQTRLLVERTVEIIGEREGDELSLADYVRTVKDTTSELQGAVDSVSELLPSMEESLERTIRAEHESLGKALTAHTSVVEPLLQEQQRAAGALAEAVAGELDRIGEIRDVLERLNNSFEGARGTWEKADKAIERMEQATAGALRDGFRDSLSAVARLTEEQARSQQRVTEALDAFQATNRQTMASLADASNRALNHSQEVVSEIRQTLQESLERVGERLIESQRGTSDQVATGLSALGRELRDLSVPTRTSKDLASPSSTNRPAGTPQGRVPGDVSAPVSEAAPGRPPHSPPIPDVVLDDLDRVE
jgi:hypothetical protein